MPNERILFEDDMYPGLPRVESPKYDVMWDTRSKNRRFNKRVPSTAMDADMFQAIQDLLMNKNLPYAGDIGAFGRDAWASKINSLQGYLSNDSRTIWAALQAIQRRLTAERYVVLIDEQVKEAAELLGAWTAAKEWEAVASDLEFILSQMGDFPNASWRRRVANEWLGSFPLQELMKVWEEDMSVEDPKAWARVVKVWTEFQRLVEGSR